MTLAGPLLGLSFMRTGHHCGKRHVPASMTNEQRLRALRQVWPVTLQNDFRWLSAGERYDAEQCADAELTTDTYGGL